MTHPLVTMVGMTQRTCSIDGCDKRHFGHGYCNMHYERWRKHGDPTREPPQPIEGCAIDDCEAAHYCRGWCRIHYNRWRRQGDPLVNLHAIPLLDRFNAKWTADVAACWVWTGRLNDDGYGVLDMSWRGGGPKLRSAHRLAYELLVGPIPDGLELDHLCFVRSCVNPAHLEPVTHAENLRRAARRN